VSTRNEVYTYAAIFKENWELQILELSAHCMTCCSQTNWSSYKADSSELLVFQMLLVAKVSPKVVARKWLKIRVHHTIWKFFTFLNSACLARSKNISFKNGVQFWIQISNSTQWKEESPDSFSLETKLLGHCKPILTLKSTRL